MKNYCTRVINLENLDEAKKELRSIGVYEGELREMAEKSVFRNLKIKNLDSRSANAIKQMSLSVGADVSVAKELGELNIDMTDVVISANLSQYNRLYHKLVENRMNFKMMAEEIKNALIKYDSKIDPVVIAGKEFDFSKKSYVMGILNITPDSFSDGGKNNSIEEAVKNAKEMVKQGAHIIDIGGESSRPGADYIPADKELDRILPVLERLVTEVDIPISIDTYKSEVAKECLKRGAHIINDISGLRGDSEMAKVISESDAYCILMHMQGMPKTMQENPKYDDLIDDLIYELKKSIDIGENAGIESQKIILDPGIGFGKTFDHNLEIINRLDEFKTLGKPILVGASRKKFIGDILGSEVDERLEGSLAVAAISVSKGASILRVHDVKETAKVLKVADAIKNSRIK
ncbi:dihydropteroate synthase [uncultured Ilyobacter sp.]|uniref:dihydropteroate synthase n=1 Tax=uncultured Ilyobacter sp. TaxID=544433 RepID=UPI0029F56821|nr:dihydropteroate synthase [uncultured Ilyobacter sp.]